MSKEREYRSEVFKVDGFSLMVPFGRVFLQPLEMFKEYGLIFFIGYVIISFGLMFLGLLLIIKGLEEIDIEWLNK